MCAVSYQSSLKISRRSFCIEALVYIHLKMSDKTNGEEDNDELFLDQVLNTLYDFGDKQTKKKSKKKKRKRCEEEEHVAAEDGRTESLGVQFHLDNTNTHHANREQTGPSLQQRAHVEVVTFQDPTKRPRAPQRAAPELQKPSRMTEKKKTEDAERLNLEKARLEVHRFGITGYKKEQQRVFEQERAVMLGARAPKKQYVNYKLLQEQLKDKKQKAKVVAQEQKKKTKKPNNKIRDEKKRSSSGPGSAPSGQVGRFKNGMLRLSSKDVKGIKLRISKD